MTRSVLLLRAVNVSGLNSVPMAQLRDVLSAQTDLADVSTYIASGNVICATPQDPDAACGATRAAIQAEFGVDTPVIHRTHQQLVSSEAAHPFSEGEEKLVHAMFLEAPPADGALEILQQRLLPTEQLAIVGNDLWISYGEGGVHSTKLTKAVLDRALGVAGTARNLRTTRKLIELTV